MNDHEKKEIYRNGANWNASDPLVIVDIVFENGHFSICVENISERPVYEVSIRWKPDFFGLNGMQATSKLALFENISFLPPYKTIRTYLDTSTSYFSRNEPSQITATITYQDRQNHRYKEKIHHNLDIYRDIVFVK